jgi:hypothetical protein
MMPTINEHIKLQRENQDEQAEFQEELIH